MKGRVLKAMAKCCSKDKDERYKNIQVPFVMDKRVYATDSYRLIKYAEKGLPYGSFSINPEVMNFVHANDDVEITKDATIVRGVSFPHINVGANFPNAERWLSIDNPNRNGLYVSPKLLSGIVDVFKAADIPMSIYNVDAGISGVGVGHGYEVAYTLMKVVMK